MISTYLDLSTAHLRQETAAMLSRAPGTGKVPAGWPAMTIAKYLHGWFITVPPTEFVREAQASALIGGFPEELAEILTYADQEKCTLLRFDSDGEKIDELETFDW